MPQLPGLFEETDLVIVKKEDPLPVHPSIARHAAKASSSKATAAHMQPLAVADKIKFISFGSGSSGNCAFLGDEKCGFLIDAGVDGDKVAQELKRNGLSIDNVKGICLTHDHGDHIRFAYSIVRKYRHLSIYCTPKALNGIMRRHNVSRRLKDYHKPIYKETEFRIGDFVLTPFEVMHDGTDNVGFSILHGDHRFVVATDLGCISERADYYMRQADYLMIESNYDKTMLVKGTYPEYLKARIMADTGHLDNAVAAQYLASIYSRTMKYVFLCHLSHDNNNPEIALETVSKALKGLGIRVGDGSGSLESRQADIQLVALPRFEASMMYVFRK